MVPAKEDGFPHLGASLELNVVRPLQCQLCFVIFQLISNADETRAGEHKNNETKFIPLLLMCLQPLTAGKVLHYVQVALHLVSFLGSCAAELLLLLREASLYVCVVLVILSGALEEGEGRWRRSTGSQRTSGTDGERSERNERARCRCGP
jgi:hypothetical protein